MTATHAKDSRLILGDYSLSGNLREVSADVSVETGDVTVLTSTARESIPGLISGKLSLGGPWDSLGTSAGMDSQIATQLQAASGEACSFAPAGFALGNPVRACVTRETGYVVAAKVSDPVDWKLELVADGAIDRALSLADLAAITADGNGAGLDNAAASTNGGAAFLHVTALTGFTGVVFKVQDSADNSAWTDLATFTTVTAATSERVTVAAGATVKRYLRAFYDVTGSGSVTFQMSFARR